MKACESGILDKYSVRGLCGHLGYRVRRGEGMRDSCTDEDDDDDNNSHPIVGGIDEN